MPNAKPTFILAYLPVLHQGYYQFLTRHSQAKALYIWGSEIIAQFDHLKRKDIRALDPKLIQKSLASWDLPYPVKIANLKTLQDLNQPQTQIILPQEVESQELAEKYLDRAQTEFDTFFLRYDRHNSTQPQPPAASTKITRDQFSQQLMNKLSQEASLSSDWWLQVGAAILRNGKILLQGYNQHLPHPQMPYVQGDPRGNFHQGENIELSTALHAEAGLIAQAAKDGLNLTDTELYVTTFPCPNCAKLIAHSGIKKVYYQDGYSMLDGEKILKDQGVEIIKVEPETSQS